MRRRRVLPIVVALAVTGVVGAGVVRGGPEPLRVRLAKVERGDLVRTVSAWGRVEPQSTVAVYAAVDGVVERCHVAEGDVVDEGQLLAELVPSEFQQRLDEAHGAVRAQRARIALAAAERSQASRHLERTSSLHQRGLASDREQQAAATALRVATARLAMATAELDAGWGRLRRAARDRQACRIRAPAAGVVVHLQLRARGRVHGAAQAARAAPVAMIVDPASMQVVADVGEADVGELRCGQPARIRLDALPGSFAGTLVHVGWAQARAVGAVDDGEARYAIRASFSAPPAALRPGLTASVVVETARRENVVLVPIEALVSRGSRDVSTAAHAGAAHGGPGSVHATLRFTVDAPAVRDSLIEGVFRVHSGRAEFVRVQTGLQDARFIVARGPLAPGDRIVRGSYRALRQLRSGRRVARDERVAEDNLEE